MSWVSRHPILAATLALALLVAAGVTVLIVQVVRAYRAAKAAHGRVGEPVGAIAAGLDDAQRRVGELEARQVDLTDTIGRVSERTEELGSLLGVAGKALAVLRGPLKYLGR